ncbi:MAG TPA: allantoinase AllB [Gemmatimonadaceae bacterium]|nr:allantoinase AllB [Gemmatimonadaceae bacterium]
MRWHRHPSVVVGERVATPNGVVPASIHIADGRIVRVGGIDDIRGASPFTVLDAGDSVVLPGLVDTHVHANEPGRTDWEGFASVTRAAAAGGVTTLLDMPLNSVPATTMRSALSEKRACAEGQCMVDVGFIGGVVPGNTDQLTALWNDGVFAFKCFMVPSGVDEFEHMTEAHLRDAMPVLRRLGATLMVHAETPGPIEHAAASLTGADPRKYQTYLASRPSSAEVEAVGLVLQLAGEFGTRVHIVHVASADVVPLLAAARRQGVPVTAETCPHYLTIEAAEIPDGATAFKCAPPIRESEHRDALWAALSETIIDQVASDHSPCPPAMKMMETGDFFRAWGGIASIELMLPVVWTAMRERSMNLVQLARLLCENPARLAGLTGYKGQIAPGNRADLVMFDSDSSFVVDPVQLHHRHKVTPYAGRTLHGAVQATYRAGELIFVDGDAVGLPAGAVLTRGVPW